MSLAEARQSAYPEAEKIYLQILNEQSKNFDNKEAAILELGKLYANNEVTKLSAFIVESRGFMVKFAKAKTAKVLKTLIDLYDNVPGAIEMQIGALKESIEFATQEKRIFLRHSLQIKLAGLFYQKKSYNDALAIINDLLREFKKLDDKSSLVDVQLLEAQIYHQLRNLSKARASLTSARTSANSIYCPTATQAQLDLMSGILNAEDKDYKTAYSYFYEAFEAFHSSDDTVQATRVLKYMLLSKIMLNLIDDVNTILGAKYAQQYNSRDIDAMKAIAVAYSERSLLDFQNVLTSYDKELKSDAIIRSHFNALYDTLLEQNLCKIIEPFEVVEISHIAQMIQLDVVSVEGKLSQMILDKVFYGVLDQGHGWLYVYDQPAVDATYDSSLELVKHLSTAVELLYDKAASL